jgi:hypothetical protein
MNVHVILRLEPALMFDGERSVWLARRPRGLHLIRDRRLMWHPPFGECRSLHSARYNPKVRVSGPICLLCGLPMLLMGLPVEASVVPTAKPLRVDSARILTPGAISDTRLLRESLRSEVARHPDDYVVFATEAGAKQFFAKHRNDVERETDLKILDRGVVGYWQDKTIVVLPWDSLDDFQ